MAQLRKMPAGISRSRIQFKAHFSIKPYWALWVLPPGMHPTQALDNPELSLIWSLFLGVRGCMAAGRIGSMVSSSCTEFYYCSFSNLSDVVES